MSAKLYYKQNFYERDDKHKFLFDDVTDKDVKVHDFIIEKATKLFPDLGIIGEEGDKIIGKEYCLIIDPIDGRFNYKHQIPNYGTQICLLKNEKPIFSCLYLPAFDDLYYFYGKSFKNGKQISVSKEKELNEMVVAFGDYQTAENIEKQCQIMNILAKNLKRIRMFGSSCVDSCFLAGVVDAYIVFVKNIWDIKPGEFLIKNAGGLHLTNKEKSIQIYGKRENVIKIKKLLKKLDELYENNN